MGRPRKYSDEDILQRLRDITARLGRTPRFSEVSSLSTVIVHRFGTYNAALQLAGLPVRRRGGRHRIGRTCPRLAALSRIADVREYWLSTDKSLSA